MHILALYNKEEEQVRLQWVTAHRGLRWNEEADRCAEEVIDESDLRQHSNLPNPFGPL